MGLLDSTLNADGAIFLADFGEEVIYTPLGGSPKTIVAIVNRTAPQLIQGSGTGGAALETDIEIQNDAALGVTSVNVGGDTVQVANRVGGTATKRTIDGIITQDLGIWHLRLR